MRADHPQRGAAPGGHRQLQRRLGETHRIRLRIDIQIHRQNPVKARRIRCGLRIMHRREHRGIIQQGNLLPRVIGKTADRLAGAQARLGREMFQRPGAALGLAGVGCLDDHHRIGVDAAQHMGDRPPWV